MIKSIFKFPNNMVAVFNENDKQEGHLQGWIGEALFPIVHQLLYDGHANQEILDIIEALRFKTQYQIEFQINKITQEIDKK